VAAPVGLYNGGTTIQVPAIQSVIYTVLYIFLFIYLFKKLFKFLFIII
jgi:hypothetical protein